MCFDPDSHPPIAEIAGGALDHDRTTLGAADGNRLLAFRARAAQPSGAGIVVVPDVRGLHAYYEELALRFAEHGVDAIAIDPYGRTAGTGPRGEPFDYTAHVGRASIAGLGADIAAGVADLRGRDPGRVRSVFTVGFCFGGRAAFLGATLGLRLGGVIGFYGWPVGERWGTDIPAPSDVAAEIEAPVLGIFGGADAGIPPEAVAEFDRSLRAAGVEHELVTYPGAPHSFFDRKAADFADASAAAWDRVLQFIAAHTAPA
jgi:carboxymethylenebutenolidase